MAAAPSSRWLHVEAHHGRRQQAHGAEDRETSAHAVGDGEDVLAAEGVGQVAEPARLAGDGDHAAAELFLVAAARFSQGVEEDAEGDGRFQRAAALADDDDAPVVAALDQIEQALHGVVVDVVALEVDARPAAAPLAGNLVVIRMAAGLEQRPGAHVRAADPQHHHPIHLLGQPVAGGDDPIQQRAVFVQQPLGQVEEGGVQRLHLLRHRHAPLVDRQVVEHFLPRGGQPRGQPLQVGLDQARLPHKRRGVLRGNQTGIVVGDGGEGFHGRGQGLGVRDAEC